MRLMRVPAGSRPRVAEAVACAAASRAALALMARISGERWRRTNYRGRQVTLLGGPALAVAGLGCLAVRRPGPAEVTAAALIGGCGAVLAGVLDDLYGDGGARGFRGHLRALRHGQLTTGSAKIALIGGAGLVAGGLAAGGSRSRRVVAGLLVSSSANFLNLLDLRPGRATRGALVVAVPLALAGGRGSAVARVVTGASAGIMPAELAEQTMLGDAGANAVGALVGVAYVAGASTPRIVTALAVLAALTAAAEVVSFTDVIEATPWLRRLDEWGRHAA